MKKGYKDILTHNGKTQTVGYCYGIPIHLGWSPSISRISGAKATKQKGTSYWIKRYPYDSSQGLQAVNVDSLGAPFAFLNVKANLITLV